MVVKRLTGVVGKPSDIADAEGSQVAKWGRFRKVLEDHPGLLFFILAAGIPLAVSLALGIVALLFVVILK